MGKNEERAKVSIFYNKMEETDQLGLEPVVKLTRESTAISYDLAKQIPLLTSSNESWTDAIRAYFNSETLSFFDYSFRDHGKIVPALSSKKSCLYHVYYDLIFFNNMIGSSGYSPKIPPSPSVSKDTLPFDMCARLGKMHI